MAKEAGLKLSSAGLGVALLFVAGARAGGKVETVELQPVRHFGGFG